MRTRVRVIQGHLAEVEPQKPRCRLEGMHGTRNTVPSRAERPGERPQVLAKSERMA